MENKYDDEMLSKCPNCGVLLMVDGWGKCIWCREKVKNVR